MDSWPKCLTWSFQGIDDEGEELDINEIRTETEESAEPDTGDISSGGNTAGVNSADNGNGRYEDDDIDGSDSGSDVELGDETDDEE